MPREVQPGQRVALPYNRQLPEGRREHRVHGGKGTTCCHASAAAEVVAVSEPIVASATRRG
ncbi:MAG: hypothetical protein ACRDPY_34705 [Streptosporangiaceae bacterium]